MRALFLLISFIVGIATASAADVVDVVRGAISNSVRWQERWFGESFGAACVRAAAKRNATMRVSLGAGNAAGFEEGAGRPFAAYIEGTNVLYSGTVWSMKASVEPSAGNPGTCEPGEIKEQVTFSEDRGTVLNGVFEFSARAKPKRPSIEESTRIDAMVLRSVTRHLRSKGLQESVGLHIATYELDDPMLIAMADSPEEVYLVDFPPVDLVDESTVVAVFSSDVFIGPDPTRDHRAKVRSHLLKEIRAHSRRVTAGHSGAK